MAKKLSLKTSVFIERCIEHGFLDRDGEQIILTELGEKQGGEFKGSKRFGSYFIWPEDFKLTED